MRIGIVLDRSFPPDERVDNRAASLTRAAHEVHVLCCTEETRLRHEMCQGIFIHRMPPSRPWWVNKLNMLVFKTGFLDPLWFRHIVAVSRRRSIEALQVLDLPLARTGIAAGRLLGIPVVFDMLEEWPEKMMVWSRRHRLSVWERMSTYSYRRLKRLERHCLRACDHVLCPAYFDLEYIRASGISLEKVSVIPNYVDTSVFDPLRVARSRETRAQYAGNWAILFVGTMGYHRGLDTAVRAMPHVVQQVPNAMLYLGGESADSSFRPWLEGIIQDVDMQGRVKLLGWIKYRKIPEHLAECQVSIVPFSAGVPGGFDSIHKIFQSMAMGKPVVVTDIADFRQNIEALQCGLVVPPDNPQALADAVVQLYRKPRLAQRLGRNGRQAVQQHYNWQTGGERLVTLYRGLEGHHPGKPTASNPLSPANRALTKPEGSSDAPAPRMESGPCNK